MPYVCRANSGQRSAISGQQSAIRVGDGTGCAGRTSVNPWARRAYGEKAIFELLHLVASCRIAWELTARGRFSSVRKNWFWVGENCCI